MTADEVLILWSRSNRIKASHMDVVKAELQRLREIEALVRANYKASACLDQVVMDEPECGECSGCKLRAALEAK
jgi:7-cyano-7-deazaguanine synthase in queuosine biosynthesis